ncbi:hypothetical protein D3C76_1815660 [compost metagenome]
MPLSNAISLAAIANCVRVEARLCREVGSDAGGLVTAPTERLEESRHASRHVGTTAQFAGGIIFRIAARPYRLVLTIIQG